jgi:hypothetical protein
MEEYSLRVFEKSVMRRMFNLLLDLRFQVPMTVSIKTVVFLSLNHGGSYQTTHHTPEVLIRPI